MRRPNGGGGGNGSCNSANKYAVPVTTASGKVAMVGGVGGGVMRGEQMMMTAEEYKQHLANASSASHISPYSVITTIQQQGGMPPSAQSPKTRTKVKVSGGTQTTNDLHEMGGSRVGSGGSHSTLYAQHQHPHHQHHMLHHHHHHHSQTLPGHGSSGAGVASGNPSEGEYAASSCSRNSGSFAPSSSASLSSSQQQIKSLSLTTPTAAQLSQSLRERILGSQSLPKGATSSADYAAILAAIQQQQQHHHHLQHQQIYGTPNSSRDRMSRYAAAAAAAAAASSGSNSTSGTTGNGKNLINDGSLSDAAGGYAAYNEIYASTGGVGGASSGTNPYSWMRHSTGYASSITSAPNRLIGGESIVCSTKVG